MNKLKIVTLSTIRVKKSPIFVANYLKSLSILSQIMKNLKQLEENRSFSNKFQPKAQN